MIVVKYNITANNINNKMKVVFKFAYDGRLFYGYARQPNLKTVEGEIIESLIKHKLIKNTTKSNFRSASRTDKGVSALCNVIAFDTNNFTDNILELLSNNLKDIIIYASAEAEKDFNPRYAKQRQYRYYLNSKDLDVEKIIFTSSIFTGEHNFSNFARIEKHRNPIRIIDNIIFSELDDYLIIDFFAQTYLWQQIRRIVFALEKVGKGKLSKEQLILALENPNNKIDFGVSSAESLILKNILYDFDFNYNEKLFKQAKEIEQEIIR